MRRKFSGFLKSYKEHVIPEWTWVKLKPYLLLRKLIDDNLATPITATQGMQHINADMKSNPDVVVQKAFTDMTLDIFR